MKELIQVNENPAGGLLKSQGDGNLLPIYLLRYDRAQTRRAYKNDLVSFFESDHVPPAFVRDITFVHINAHILSLEESGIKASTIKRRIAALRGFFSWCMAIKILDANPADRMLIRKVRAARTQDRAITFLSANEAKQLLKATEHAGEAAVRDHAIISVLLYCVLRRSEAAAMDVKHVRPAGPYWILDLPLAKGGSDQFVKMPAHVVEVVHNMQQHYGITEGPLWLSMSKNDSTGKRLSPSAIYEMVRRTARRAALSESIGAHTLRHTGCTLAIDAGASVQQVQTHARHKKLETTMVYVHQRDKLRNSAADFINLDGE